MTASLDLGDNYQIEENSNGNLVVRDSGGTIVLKHEDGGNFQLGDAGLELGDLIDGSSGATVYDGASETLGDGNQDADLQSLSTGDLAVDTDGSGGTTDDILRLESDTGDVDAQDRQQVTQGVSTSATEILPFDSNQSHSIVLVQGVQDNDPSQIFWDVVHARLDGADKINQSGQNASTRTYTTRQDGSQFVLELTMGSDSFDVIARAVESGGLLPL